MKKVAVILCLVSGLAGAQPVPDAFALQLPIEMPVEASLVSLRLPADVYRVVRRADLGDLRILNGAGEAVPMALLPMRTDVRDERRELPLVPLPTRATTADPSMVVSAAGGGSVVHVEIAGESMSGAPTMPGYLLDTGEHPATIDAIELSWAGSPDFEAALQVRASDDLSQWHTVVERASLLATGSGASRIEHRHIDLPSVNARYLRLEWRETPPLVTLTGATLVRSQRSALPPREWIDLAGERSGDAVRYVSPGLFPVDALTVVPTTPADVLAATVESRAEPTQRWTSRGRVQAYRLTQDGKTIEAAPGEIPRTRDPLWQLGFVGGVPSSGLPALRLGWHPDAVVFVARGEGPFTLVAGNASIAPAWQSVHTVIPGYGTHGEVRPAPARVGSAASAVTAAPRAESPWQQSSQWLLWGALLLGVGVLGWMARGLMREMSSGGGADKS